MSFDARSTFLVLTALLGMLACSAAQELTAAQKEQLDEMRRLGYQKLYSKKFDEAKAQFETMIGEFPTRWEGYYDMACYHLRQKDQESAFQWLTKSVDQGCDDITLFRTDSDLRVVRKERPEEFRELLAKVEANAKKRAQARIMEKAKKLASSLPQNRLFPFDFSLPQLLDDGDVSLDDLKGNVVVVDIWGTWCPPCRMEVPHFVDLVNKYHDSGFRMIGINFKRGGGRGYLDYDAARTKVAPEARKMNINYPLLHGDNRIIAKVPGFSGFPTTLFIDHEGNVRKREVGYKSLEQLEPIVLALLSEKLDADKKAAEEATEKEAESEVPEKSDGEKEAEKATDTPG